MKITKTAISLAFVTLVAACGSGSDDNGLTAVLSDAMVNQMQGNWLRRGYGVVYAVEGANFTIHEITRHSCHSVAAGSVQQLGELYPYITVDDQQLTMREIENGFAEHFERIDSVPAQCSDPVGNDAAAMFEHVWHTFNDYYAFFDLYGVDWTAQYNQVRPGITQATSPAALRDAVSALVEPIDDVHVSLTTDDYYSPGNTGGFVQELADEFAQQSKFAELTGYIGDVFARWRSALDTNYLGGQVSGAGGPNNDVIEWGVIPGNGAEPVGYVLINGLIFDLEQPIATQAAQMDEIFDRVLTDLSGSAGIIIDTRFSPGGSDAIAATIANRFTDQERVAVRKAPRSYQGDGVEQALTLMPAEGGTYSGPVVLITSALSASATEVFTLMMRSLPQVTHIGGPTSGALSDKLERNLPNGWQFALSNEVYRDHNDQVHEGSGIPPHQVAPVFRRAERDRGEDSAVNAALALLRN